MSCLTFIIIELIDQKYKNDEKMIEILHFFKVIYIFRGIRLLYHLEFTYVIIYLIKINIFTFIYAHFLLFIVLFIFALFGFQFLEGIKLENTEISNAYNFNTFGSSFITVFNIVTLENWYLSFVEFSSNKNINAFLVIFYFLSIIIFGNLLIYHLFLAIMLDSFETLNKINLHEEVEKYDEKTYSILYKYFKNEENKDVEISGSG